MLSLFVFLSNFIVFLSSENTYRAALINKYQLASMNNFRTDAMKYHL